MLNVNYLGPPALPHERILPKRSGCLMGNLTFRISYLTLRNLLSARESREAHQASLGKLEASWRCNQRASARGVEQAMPQGLTLDRRGETGRTKAARQRHSSMQNPGRFQRGAQSPPVKGGIAHACWRVDSSDLICSGRKTSENFRSQRWNWGGSIYHFLLPVVLKGDEQTSAQPGETAL
jgi:hypothetical protein